MNNNSMKIIRLITFLLVFLHINTGYAKNMNIYNFSFEDIDGNLVSLDKFNGKPIFMVNTASRCGFTPQYENLQNLFINYKDTDLTILAITSNSFNQEYSNNEDILGFAYSTDLFKPSFLVMYPSLIILLIMSSSSVNPAIE